MGHSLINFCLINLLHAGMPCYFTHHAAVATTNNKHPLGCFLRNPKVQWAQPNQRIHLVSLLALATSKQKSRH